MNEVIFSHWGLVITPWKLVGYLGVIMFAGRWVIQVIYSVSAQKPTFPRIFWYMSLSGSLMVLSYFIFGKTDSVGILSNLFPALIACYNLFLDIQHKKASGQSGVV